MKSNCLLLFLSMCFLAQAQFKNSIWCFGDSARIDFVNGNALIKRSAVVSRGSCLSIASPIDSLLFYGQVNYKINPSNFGTNVFSFNDSMMSNADSLRGEGWYQELVCVNKPGSIDTFYLFQSKVASTPQGLFYSTVVLNKSTGLGKVIKKNKKLNNLWQMDCINAVKHGNGKDWWIITRNWNQDILQPYNSWQFYLITENGITDTIIQNVGSTCITNNTYSAVSMNGKRIAFVSNMNIIEVYDFDRCTGLLSNAITIHAQIPFGGDANSGVEFSASGRFLYVSDLKENTVSQFDLYAANIAASEVVLYDDVLSYDSLYFGMLKRAPDNKIYMTHWYIATGGAAFPYPPNFHNQYTDNLSVINFPDSAGAACGFSLCSFYLGGNRSYEGLPNNPNYEMGPDTASSCDTLGLAIQEENVTAFFKLFPNPAHDKIELELSPVLANNNCKIYIINSLGSIVKTLQSQSQNNLAISIANLSSGIYLLQVSTSKINATLKFVKE